MRLAFLLALLLIPTLAACQERHSWNERATVTVRTPDGIVTGTSVIEFWATWCPEGCGFPPRRNSRGFTGEAVVVELAPERYLFVLPETFLDNVHQWAPDVLGRTENTGERLRLTRNLTEPVTVPPDAYPDMITFLEPGNVDSFVQVDPTNFAETFGEGYELVAMTLEVTDERQTEPRIAELLRWTCEPLRMENGDHREIRVGDDSPRGWYGVGSFDLGRMLSICS